MGTERRLGLGGRGLAERLHEEDTDPYDNAGVGHVECGPVVNLVPMHVHKIDNVAQAQPVNEVVATRASQNAVEQNLLAMFYCPLLCIAR